MTKTVQITLTPEELAQLRKLAEYRGMTEDACLQETLQIIAPSCIQCDWEDRESIFVGGTT